VAGRQAAGGRAPDAVGLALAYLNRRERTEAELRTHLERAGCLPVELEDAIDELRRLGLVDDARFARLFAQDRRELDDWGQDRIARRLRELGIDRDLIGETLIAERGEERERAISLLTRRFPDGPGDPDDTRVGERAFGVLVRKGYDSEIAADAVRQWNGGSQ
jgi:regulatory protein